ncbi:outer membrane protein OmpU [Sulfitobacter marinus]|uniref:Outer membrane protein OmpU n=1 Tax=Sulfitobacter marinus TaxID=394264 RepID=A0A1I6TK50_9RHOB|nr:porin [Sulfitobacter marinus]SFS89613.1 outer membrane protein OmpU [Sulfitobacter marinus]
MKKVLFATTALVATAGVAAADVTFGGYARFGVAYTDDVSADTNSTDVTSRFRLNIDATAESDAGVTFGARVRFQQNNSDEGTVDAGADDEFGTDDDVKTGGPAGTKMNGARFFARSGGLEVGVGNIYGAIEFMPGMYPIDLGLTGLGYDYTAYAFKADAYQSGSSGAAGSNGVEVMYSMGDFGMHLSASDTNDRVAAHVSYSVAGYTFALGGQDSDSDADTEFAVSASGTMGPADLTLAYADNGTTGKRTVLAATFDVGAATNVQAYVADDDSQDDTGYGIDFNHSMGGGTSLRGGVAKRLNGDTSADLGVRFNF